MPTIHKTEIAELKEKFSRLQASGPAKDKKAELKRLKKMQDIDTKITMLEKDIEDEKLELIHISNKGKPSVDSVKVKVSQTLGTVFINNVDLSHVVKSINFSMTAGQIPIIVLELVPQEIELDAANPHLHVGHGVISKKWKELKPADQ